MADNNGGFRPQIPKNAMDNSKLGLRAPNRINKMASLSWRMLNNNPRITVYTNDPDDTVDYGKISSHLDLPTFYMFLELVQQAIDTPLGEKYWNKLENKKYTFPGGKRSEHPEVTDSLVVGKDEDGLIWICVDAPRRPKIKFPFMQPDFHALVHRDGSPFTQAEASKIAAQAWVKMLSHIAVAVNVQQYKHPEPKDSGAGGNRGGGNRGGGNYGGGNRGGGSYSAGSGDGADDDIPW